MRRFKKTFREAISKLISELLNAKLTEFIIQRERQAREISLVERLLRVEEELKALRELQGKQFEAIMREMNTRFEAIQREMNSRFEAMNARFEALQREMDTRFEVLERRLNFLQWAMAVGFGFLSILIALIKFS